MRKRLPYALAVAGLLLVGAGCGGGGVAENTVTPPAPAAPAAMKPQAPKSEIDTSVDAMLKSSDDEKAAQADVESDAGEVDADKSGIDAYGESSYDVNQ